mgnify:CR=1 FL=1
MSKSQRKEVEKPKGSMNIQSVSISEVKLNPNNPRLVKDDKFAKLVKSIKEFPQMLELRPIVVNDDMIVLGGNMRLKACKEAGLKEVPVIKASDLTEEQQEEIKEAGRVTAFILTRTETQRQQLNLQMPESLKGGYYRR